jgi:uncharacterized repeat protein (TIGR03803 family)
MAARHTARRILRNDAVAPPVNTFLPLFTRLLWAAAFVLPAFCAQAGVILTNLHSFTSADGANPYAGLVQGADGNFYGTTYAGGSNSAGTVFKISPNGALTSLAAFDGTDGANPEGGLVQGSNGFFYGTTYKGGSNEYSYGTVFQIGSNGGLVSLYSFGRVLDAYGVALDGGLPNCSLVQVSNGVFYGTCTYGGTNDSYPGGTVFQIATNGSLTLLWSFTGGSDGSGPEAGLVRGSDGIFYGTTSGSYGLYGGVFKLPAQGTVTGLYSFSGGSDGASPYGALAQGSDSNFYGTTAFGGAFTNGTVFRISAGGAFSNLYSFTGGSDGANPYGALAQGSDGYFYGTTASGGAHTNGTVFRISAGGVLTSLYSFTGGNDGGKPYGGLVQGGNGFFYGTTLIGGTNRYGSVFRLGVAPEFQAVTLADGTLNLTWNVEIGGQYQLQFVPDLNSSNWTDLSNAVTATAATLNTTDAVTNAPQKFYRLELLQ